MDQEQDPVAELCAISAALRVHLEWHQRTGSVGLPRDPARLAASVGAAPNEPAPAGARVAEPAVRLPTGGGEVLHARPPAPAAAAHPATSSDVAAPTMGGDADARERASRRLRELAETVKSCTRCPLAAGRTNTVFSRGTGSSGLCFVGEGPGADEDAQGLPFVGAAGQLLDRMIAAMGFSRDEVYVCNIVKCRPPKNRKPEPNEIAECIPYLREQIELIDPQVIVALGATAVQGLLGTTEGIMRLRGKWKLYKGRIAVMPTFHPAYLLRTPEAKRDVWMDLQAVLRQMGRAIPGKS